MDDKIYKQLSDDYNKLLDSSLNGVKKIESLQKEIENLKTTLGQRDRILKRRTEAMNDFNKAYYSLVAGVDNVIDQSEDKWTKGYLKQALEEAEKSAPNMVTLDG